MRLIDADMLKERLYYFGAINKFGDVNTSINQINKAINKASADAVPVNHGQWLPAYNPDGTIINGVKQCSNCGEIFNEYPNYPFCGNCGSNNKGDKNE